MGSLEESNIDRPGEEESGGSLTGREIVVGLSASETARMRVIQRILGAPDRESYMQRQRQGAKELGISVRSMRRLLQRWREQGIAGLVSQEHRDKGEPQTSREWQRYILKTWREGNREGRRLSPAQVYVRVRTRAEEQGKESHPSRSTVYRLLRPEITKKKRKEQIGSIGWRGSRLKIRTRNGIEIEVDHSNQVWQADHTYALGASFLTKPKSPKVFPDNSFSDISDFRSGNIELF